MVVVQSTNLFRLLTYKTSSSCLLMDALMFPQHFCFGTAENSYERINSYDHYSIEIFHHVISTEVRRK